MLLLGVGRGLLACQVGTSVVRRCSSISRQEVFFRPEVQSLLKRLTGLQYDKVFRRRKLGKVPQRPVYQFMTGEELEEAMAEVRQKAELRLAMPPVMEERGSISSVLEEDPQLVGFDTCNYMFTDISFGESDRARLAVVREPSGRLRTAEWEERDRLNQLYFPRPGRRHYSPQMFQPDTLAELLGPDRYEQILDRACLQFEPDHPTYIRTCQAVYQHILDHRQFDTLLSTRHYGGLVFWLVWTRQACELVAALVRAGGPATAAPAIQLYIELHPDSKLADLQLDQAGQQAGDEANLVASYARLESVKPGTVHQAVETWRAGRATLSSHGASQL